ncbi:MAG: formate dehydrogenase subunit gamma, partial [Alphaproteobacteria bacterium]|nr:formate dehydrogenase subunit gamma [Alphaproteobacteria bacterium]
MFKLIKTIRHPARIAALLMLAAGLGVAAIDLPGLSGMALAQQAGEVPGDSLGAASDADFWRAVREGQQFTVSIPDKKAGVMIQSEGENWRNARNGPVTTIGGWVIVGMLVVLGFFFGLRGRIRIDSGLSGKLIQRFSSVERIGHWLTAGSFIVLGLTGLNVMYGRYLFGKGGALPGDFSGLHQFFAFTAYYGKLAHSYIAFAFMAGIVMIVVLWVKDNIPRAIDLKWLAVGGGLFSKDVHPPAKKFNAGQKFIFWTVVLGGTTLSVSGLALMFPFTFGVFAPTFEVLNYLGLNLPTTLTVIEEMQLSQLWHAVVAAIMIAIIIAHIYIGSLGMEGAWDAMGSGMVDENWAREHHGLWMAEVKG